MHPEHDHRPHHPSPLLAPQRLRNSLVTAINHLDTHARWVITSNASRTGITFHNPGREIIVVFPELVLIYGIAPNHNLPSHDDRGVNLQGHNERLRPTRERLGGGFMLHPTATLFFTDPTCQQAWQALALNGFDNPLTIMEQG